MVTSLHFFMLYGLVWSIYKLGWVLKKWKVLVSDLVKVNQIICTPPNGGDGVIDVKIEDVAENMENLRLWGMYLEKIKH